MRQRPFILVALIVSVCGSGISARAQDQAVAPAASAPAKPQQPAANAPAADSNRQAPAAKPAAPGVSPDANAIPAPDSSQDSAKPAAKPRHVITNEDIQAEHGRLASANADVDIGNINDCDAVCFQMVHNLANYYLVRNSDWQHDLLRGIGEVTDDPKWQAALFHIARMKARFCELNQDKNDDLSDVADPRKMTEDEISVDQEYDRKFKAAQAELNEAYAEADAAMRGYGGIILPFMTMQKQRAGNRVCVIHGPMFFQGYRPPVDNPSYR